MKVSDVILNFIFSSIPGYHSDNLACTCTEHWESMGTPSPGPKEEQFFENEEDQMLPIQPLENDREDVLPIQPVAYNKDEYHVLPNPLETGKPVHVILMTEGRSGSTWLSSFFWKR